MLDDKPISLEFFIADIKAKIVEIIGNSQVTRPGPVLMTYVGSQFVREKGVPFDQFLNFVALQNNLNLPLKNRKMVPFVRAYCGDRVIIGEDQDGTLTADLLPDSEPRNEEVEAAGSEHAGDRFKKGVWLAFIRPLEPGKRRYLNLNDRAGFTDMAGEASDPAWKEVDRRSVLGIPQSSPVDPQAVIAKIVAWAKETNVPLADLREPKTVSRAKYATLADLVRIVEALPSEVAAKWKIPADVILHLRK